MLQSLICGLEEKEHLLPSPGRVRSTGSLGRQAGVQEARQTGSQAREGAAGKAGPACTPPDCTPRGHASEHSAVCCPLAACPQPAAHQAPSGAPSTPSCFAKSQSSPPPTPSVLSSGATERKQITSPRGQALPSSPLFCGCSLLPNAPFPGSSQFHSFQRLPRLQICPPDTTAKNMHS